MLVVTRIEGQEVVIGDPPIGRVRVASVKGAKVRLAFDFAKEVSIDRSEVRELKVKEREAKA